MVRTKNKDKVKDPFAFDSDAESDDEAKLSVKRKRSNSGNSTPHSVNGLDDGGGSPCRDEDGGRKFWRTAGSQLVAGITCANLAIRTLMNTFVMSKAIQTWRTR
jgi:hypothetical protein